MSSTVADTMTDVRKCPPQSIWRLAHSTRSPCLSAVCVAACHWPFGLWDCTGMYSLSIVFDAVIDTNIRGLLFPLFVCVTQVPPIASVCGTLCGQDMCGLALL